MSNELATRSAGLQLTTMDDVARAAKMMADSGYFADARDAAQAGVKIMAGQGWGIQPFDAMTGIHLIKGKPSIGAGLMAAKVKGSGRYDYRVREMTEKACRIEFFEGSESLGISSFTIEEARKAGTQNLDKFARNMLFARAMSNGVKWFVPDVFNAPVYTAEELGAEVDGDGNIVDVTSYRAEPVPAQVEAPVVEPEPPAEPLITDNQKQALAIAIRSADLGSGEEGKAAGRAFVSFLAGLDTPVESITHLTASQAAAALDALGGGDNGSYRTDAGKLADAITSWHESLDLQSNPIPDFDPNEKPSKKLSKPRADMKPIGEDEAPA